MNNPETFTSIHYIVLFNKISVGIIIIIMFCFVFLDCGMRIDGGDVGLRFHADADILWRVSPEGSS